MTEHNAENDRTYLAVSRRGIVHVVRWSDDGTACGKGGRDLVLVGAVGIGERMCHSCATRVTPPAEGSADV